MAPQTILLGAVLSQVADAVSFSLAVARYGIEHEANSWAVWLYALGGTDAVLVAKGTAIVVMIALLSVAAARSKRVLVMGGATATSVGLLGFVTNSWSMAILGA